ncbi:hypothetical protein [Effusibacillus pohliae]|uniref:hypothetical protein n=1 Tax=Effusibacillus pohliae TaxID=232270 RepID=UPI000377B206|nr:hypothetical protein [Effusibacillus pohliae]
MEPMDKFFDEARQHVRKTLQVSDEVVFRLQERVMRSLPNASKSSIQNSWTKSTVAVLAIVGTSALIVPQVWDKWTDHPSVQLTDPSSKTPQAETFASASTKWQLVGKTYTVQGIIVSINQTPEEFKSLSLKVEKNIIGSTSSVDNPNFPFQVGSTVEIRFDERLADKGAINPRVGDQVILSVGQFALSGSQSTFWGSKFNGYVFEQGGKFYNSKGEIVLPYNIVVTSPTAGQSIKSGSVLTISGKVNGTSQSTQKVKVSLNWIDKGEARHLIDSFDYPVNPDGTFQGTFQVPKLTAYYGARGGKFVFDIEYPNAQINTVPLNGGESDGAPITLDYIKQNLKLGDTQEQVKARFGDQYKEINDVEVGNNAWRFDYVADPSYTFTGQYGDWDGLRSGRMRMQLFINWTDKSTVLSILVHYNKDGKIYEYAKKPGFERDAPIE